MASPTRVSPFLKRFARARNQLRWMHVLLGGIWACLAGAFGFALVAASDYLSARTPIRLSQPNEGMQPTGVAEPK
jgi:hypothetical protein